MMFSTIFEEFGLPLKLALHRNVQAAIEEDLGHCDYTGLLLTPGQVCRARLLCREQAIVCGQPWFNLVFQWLCPDVQINWFYHEGEVVYENSVLCEVIGTAQQVLTAERSAMNFLQCLSAVATQTHRCVQVVQGTSAKILDTRKTIPGLRLAQKYAVRVGGGYNQRLALYDGILIKENHIIAAGGIQQAFERAQRVIIPSVSLQIEVESLAELEQALAVGFKSILLDNFTHDALAQAVKLNRGRAILEASGGVNLNTLRKIAETGVDRISIGSLTKNISAIDFSLRLLED